MPVLLVQAPADPSREVLAEAAPFARVFAVDSLDPATLARQEIPVAEVTAAIGFSPSDDFSSLPNLDWVHSSAAGVDAWLRSDVLDPRTTLTSAVGNGAVPLAEHALMLMLMLSRDAPRWGRAQQQRRWDRFRHGELTDCQLGIIGFGNSGQDLARKALACHMRVQALRRSGTPAEEPEVRVLGGRDGLEELLRTSDTVAITAPLTPSTSGMIGAPELELMKPSAHLVLVSRGGIIEEQALRDALHAGRIAGAALDAFEQEPLPDDSPWWDTPRVILTPHNGATTEQTLERGRRIVLDNVGRWAAGAPLRNIVDREAGY